MPHFYRFDFVFNISLPLDAEGPECDGCKGILDELENIDDDTDRHGIQFVKTTDIGMAQDYGVKDFPALVYFEKQIPNVYDGKPKSR